MSRTYNGPDLMGFIELTVGNGLKYSNNFSGKGIQLFQYMPEVDR
jgi:hypothetical protein